MDQINEKNYKSKAPRLIPKWFKRKQKRADPCHPFEVSDGDEDEDDTYLDEVFCRSMEVDPCKSTNELTIFVGTWNVAGRSPIGSLLVDLDEWMNLKDAAHDIYVLGFQEIVPLITRTVIGAEDQSKATNWNSLIGKALNGKYGCPWLTPMLNPLISGDQSHDHYVRISENSAHQIRRTSNFYSQTDQTTPTRSSENSTTSTCRPKLIGGSRYVLLASKKMVGIFISVWIKMEVLRKYYISNVKVCSVACGIMGYLGNKGSVSVSMSIEGTSYCFIAAHLASGEKKGDERRRNHQVSEIFRRTLFAQSAKDDDHDDSSPLTILRHDQIFWFGDLNYRLYLEDKEARQLIKKTDWRALQEFDQLRREQEDGIFQGWREGNIEFAPTYKYSSSNGNRYSGGPLTSSREKQRTPAWCDRILWYGKGVKQLSYFRSESQFSDHRPVSALFSTHIELLKSTNPRVVELSKFLPGIPPPKQVATGKNADEKTKPTLKSLLEKDNRNMRPNSKDANDTSISFTF